MSKYKGVEIKKFPIVEDNERGPHYQKKSKHEFVEYYDNLSKEEQRWIRKFYEEYYNGAAHWKAPEKRLIQDEEMLQEATRNNNAIQRDIWEVATTENSLEYLGEEDRQFMEDACDEWDWRRVYDILGKKEAANLIMNQALDNIENKEYSNYTALAQFYVQMDQLRRHHNSEVKLKRERKKNEKA